VFIEDDILIASQTKKNGDENLLSNRQFVGYHKQKSLNKKQQRQEINENEIQQIRATSPSPETRNLQNM
jgi:hypothetical protein